MLRVVAITGAGLSVDSGIRPYRGETGLYTELYEKYGRTAEELITATTLQKEPDLFWEFWEYKMLLFKDARPCIAHEMLVEIEQKTNFLEVTQNVDGLSLTAGMPPRHLIELHGTAHQYRCNRCGLTHHVTISEGMGTQRCYHCGDPDNAPIRPTVVMFNECIKSEHYTNALHKSKAADIFITVGTTMQFGYLMTFLEAAMGNEAIIINIDPEAEQSSWYDVTLPVTASEGLTLINSCITKDMNDREEFMSQLREKWIRRG